MSIEDKRREGFERQIKILNPDDYAEDGERVFTREGTGYDWHWVNEQWLLWNAALDSVVIDLREARCGGGGYLDEPDTIAAIESAGLKVKP